MLGLRKTTDCQPRTKNGQPAHSTMGVLSSSSSQVRRAGDTDVNWCPSIASATTMSVSGRLYQKRRWKSRYSAFSSSSSSSGKTGSSAMPHLGQVPGPGCRTSGCIGQTYSAPTTGADTGDGAR
jgi:hypothetical protein